MLSSYKIPLPVLAALKIKVRSPSLLLMLSLQKKTEKFLGCFRRPGDSRRQIFVPWRFSYKY